MTFFNMLVSLNEMKKHFLFDKVNLQLIEFIVPSHARKDFRKKSLLSPNCKAVICGLGLDSYKAGLLTLK